jgi:hypothetical protein
VYESADGAGAALAPNAASVDASALAKPPRTYVTYTAEDFDRPGKVYTGRCSGPCTMTPQEILDRREAGHHRNLGPLQIDQLTDSYPAARGREHQVFEALKAKGLATDQINPVSPRNKRRFEYFRKSEEEFGLPQ